MSTEKKKKFIIDVTYLALILVLSYLLLQYALPLLLPFVLAFLIAYVLRRPIRFLSRVLHAPKGLVAVLLVVLTYGTIGLLLALAGIRITATITSVVQQIPSLYSAYILPELTDFFAWQGRCCPTGGLMQIVLSLEEYADLQKAAAQLPVLIDRVQSLSDQLGALRTQYTQCLDKLSELERQL